MLRKRWTIFENSPPFWKNVIYFPKFETAIIFVVYRKGEKEATT